MKKFLFVFLLALIPQLCFASGKIVIEPYRNNTLQQNGMKGGLAVWQKIFKMPVFIDGFIGMGSPVGQNEAWTSGSIALGIQVKRLQFEVGEQRDYNVNYKYHDDLTFAKASYQLW